MRPASDERNSENQFGQIFSADLIADRIHVARTREQSFGIRSATLRSDDDDPSIDNLRQLAMIVRWQLSPSLDKVSSSELLLT